MKSYYTICYTSKANPELSKLEIEELFKFSLEQNTECNVSGILLHSIGNFFQVLEGNEQYLKSLFEKIKSDSRHSEIFTIYNKSTLHPTFLKYDSKFNIVKSSEDLERIKIYLEENRSYSTNDKLSRLLAPFLMFEDL